MKKKIHQPASKKVSAGQRAAGIASMGKAMGRRVGSTKAHKEQNSHKAKKI